MAPILKKKKIKTLFRNIELGVSVKHIATMQYEKKVPHERTFEIICLGSKT
jgi:hypothetical protein